MSTHKPKAKAKPADAHPITADSPAIQILRENVRLQLEIIRRSAWQRLQSLRAELDTLPPAPPSFTGLMDED